MRDHTPVEINQFNGWWQRGDIDICPIDHFTECINFKFLKQGYTTRDGLASVLADTTSVLKFYNYADASVGDSFLVLRSDNKIYHIYGAIGSFTTFQVSNAITGMTDFAFISYLGRAFISPCTNNNIGGISTEFVYVYDGGGSNMMRKAAGVAPTNADGALAAANSATVGNVEAGTHVFGVVYETNSGFLTQIGPDTLATVVADGTHSVDLSAIPVSGSSAVVKRHIVASVLIQTYSGDARAYQLFYVPGGTINDNTSTTTTVNFYDSQLITDASHLLTLNSSIPAVGGLGLYHNRVIGWDYGASIGGADGIANVLVSYPGEPEAFDAVSGILQVPREGVGITRCQEYRDVLYVMKSNKTMAFVDNGDVPTSWSSAVVDDGLGVGKYGVSEVGIYGGINIESYIAINEQGVYIFTGTFATPELTYKIRDYWRAQNMSDIRTGKVSSYTDSLNQLLYINIPSQNLILVGDWSEGLNAEKIKWTKWTFIDTPETIMLWDKDNKLFIGMPQGSHYILVGSTHDVYNTFGTVKIPNPTSITALIGDESQQQDENIYHFGGARFRVFGSGTLRPTLLGMDSVLTQTLATIAMASAPGNEPVVLSNMLTQRARLQLQTTAINETMKIDRLILYTKPTYTSLPM